MRTTFWLMIAACFMLAFPSISSATPVLKIDDGINAPIFGTYDAGVWKVTDEQLGRWHITSVIGELYPHGLEVGGSVASYGGPGDLKITFSDSFGGGGFEMPFDLAFDTVEGPANYKAYMDTTLLGEFSANGATEVFQTPGTNFSLSELVTLSDSGYYYFDASLNALPNPEPSSLILLGSGLIGASVFLRRKS